ncbi:MAG: hypothetical protein R8M11_05625 [Gallionella sp.]
MHQNLTLRMTAITVAMILSATAVAAPNLIESDLGSLNVNWSASTGLGYDSNVFRAPSAAYNDLTAAAAGALVTPKKESGFFIPYEVKAMAEKTHSQDMDLIGSVSMDGSLYLGGLANANEFNFDLAGGVKRVLKQKNKTENSLYFGVLLGKHQQIYVDRDSGLNKTTPTSGIDISGRYSYNSIGGEAEYQFRVGNIDYGINGKLIINDYQDPDAVSSEDHNLLSLGADASIPVSDQTKLDLSYSHKVRDYSKRHSRDATGLLSVANPLLNYSYDSFGLTVRNRISPQWVVYGDYHYRLRTDNHVGYNNYSRNRIGGRVLFTQARIKGRLSVHYWTRDYANGFAFDVPAGGAKTYSSLDFKLKVELKQTNNTALWTELVYDSQTATDLRFDYVRTQLMAGMNWAY